MILSKLNPGLKHPYRKAVPEFSGLPFCRKLTMKRHDCFVSGRFASSQGPIIARDTDASDGASQHRKL